MADLLRASEEGLKIIDLVRRNLGWNKTEDVWCQASLVSKATMKRFWARIGIRRENFINICKAVEMENWECIVEGYDMQKIEPLLATAIADLSTPDFLPEGFTLPDNLPSVRNWVGRDRELETLKAQIQGSDITALCIVGLVGIGKTTLASQLVRQLHAENTPFVAAAWASLNSVNGKARQYDRIIDSMLLTLSNTDTSNSPNIEEAIASESDRLDDCQKTEKLLQLIKDKPCLVVFDRVETVLQTKQAQKAGYFADNCPEYAWLFKQLVEAEHQSKIIFISQENLAELPLNARELVLNGLESEDAVALLESFNLTATPEELVQLGDRYQGHPKALQLVAALIQSDRDFQGSVEKFLQDRDWLLIRDIESLIEQILARLSNIEKTCLCRISVYHPSNYPLTFAAIAAQMPEVSQYELKENVILALKRRQLLSYNHQLQSYQIHPFVQEKADRLLCQDPEMFRTVHRRAYHYFISIPLKPESEWKDIEDIKPLLVAYYHALQAEDGDKATQAIAGIYEYLRQWNCGDRIEGKLQLPFLKEQLSEKNPHPKVRGYANFRPPTLASL